MQLNAEYSPVERFHILVSRCQFLTLATADSSGTPWSAPLYFACDQQLVFYVVTAKDSRHAQDIGQNPRVAISFFDPSSVPGNVDGAQLAAHAHEVNGHELDHAISIYFGRRFSADSEREPHLDSNQYLGDALPRFFALNPTRVFVRQLPKVGWDQREEIPIDQLQVQAGDKMAEVTT
jgi:uncharacterized protein YhbP (UPF0306 family)